MRVTVPVAGFPPRTGVVTLIPVSMAVGVGGVTVRGAIWLDVPTEAVMFTVAAVATAVVVTGKVTELVPA